MKKHSITVKIIFISFLVMFLSSFIPNILWRIFGHNVRPDEVSPTFILIGGIITVSFTLLLYSFFIEQLLIKRVRKLNEATKNIMNGNFDTVIQDSRLDEVSELTNNFNKMVEELKGNEYLNKEFVRNFSHELKTPLSAIKGYAELIQSENLSENDKEEYSRIIISESSRLSNLSRNMLLISQIDHQVIIPKNDAFNLTELFRNVVQLQQIDWEKKNISFELDVEEVFLTSNKELLYQVFQNLLSNAVRFSDNQDTIFVSIKQKDKVELSIKNKGDLSQEELSRIFDLFYIKDKSRSSKSNGVGLTLTKKIVDKLEGSVIATCESGYITFTVKL